MPAKGDGDGLVVTKRGYVRIKRRGKYRDWYLHRKVMYDACQSFCYYPINGSIPCWLTVEHLDHNPKNNCLCNLILLDVTIHNFLSSWSRYHRRDVRAKVALPEWVLRHEDGIDCWEDGRE